MKSTRKSSKFAARRVGGCMTAKGDDEYDDEDVAGIGDRPPVDKPKPDNRPPSFSWFA